MNINNWVSTGFNDISCLSFVKNIILKSNVKNAYIDVTSIGWFHVYINDKRVDTSAFTPGWTDYNKRVQYYHYNLDKFISSDDLKLRIDLGEGWGSSKTFMRFFRNGPGLTYHPKSLNFEMVIEYENGEKDVYVSDENLEVFTNKIIESSIYDGETQDLFTESKYLGKASKVSLDIDIIPQEGEDIIFGERIPAKDLFKDNEGNLIVDFGQNFAGIVEVNLNAEDGEVLSYTPGEVLDKNGVFYNKNYRSAKSFYSFKLSKNIHKYVADFSFLGGRYLKLIEYPKNIKKENFTAVLVHSDMERTCFYSCKNEKINRLYLNCLYGQLSNYLDVPTDCPQRDERAGWLADTHVFCSTGAVQFNVNKFFKKWLKDLCLEQKEDGAIQGVCPLITGQSDIIGSGWADACCIVPFEVYKAYGDKEILANSIDMMKKWIKYCTKFYKQEYIVELPFAWGDWLALDKATGKEWQGLTRFDLISTAFFAYDLQILIYSLKELKQDYTEYEKLLENVKKAYQKAFISNGHMVGEPAHLFSDMDRTCYTQTGIVLTLYFDLVDEETKKLLAQDLVKLIKECGDKMTTGFLGTPYILKVLSENGYDDVAYTLLLQEEYPSWLYSVNKGATTMWEHYDGIKEDGSFWNDSMNSYNHYAYGSVFHWIFMYSVGIRQLKPKYEKVLIKPTPNKNIGESKCLFKTCYGDLIVDWKFLDDYKVEYNIVVPKGIDVTIDLGEFKTSTNDGININRILNANN